MMLEADENDKETSADKRIASNAVISKYKHDLSGN